MGAWTQDYATLSPEQRELFALLLQQTGMDAATSLPIPRRPAETRAPLSSSQRRLWFTDLVADSGGIQSPNNNPNAWRLQGPVHVSALEQSFDALVRRHEILRTTCSVQEGEPVQIVVPAEPFTLLVTDLRGLPASAQEREVERLVHREAQHCFQLDRGPLLRARLLQVGDAEYVLLLTTHYFVADGLSEGILLRELAAHYEAFASGATPQLPDLPIQYADFALWQREWLNGDGPTRQLAYWKHHLRNSPTQPTLTADCPAPPVQTFQGAYRHFVLPVDLSTGIRAASRREGVTRFMLLLAAWQTVLHLRSGQNDVVVGTTVSNRPRPETEELIGFFSNNLLLRTDFSGNPTVRDLLQRVSQVAVGAYSHQDLPFEDLIKELLRDPEVGGVPPLETVLVLHERAPAHNLQLPGVVVRQIAGDGGTATFDLALRLADGEGAFTGSVEYRTDLFATPTIDLLLEQFQAVLEHFVTNPEQRVDDLRLSLAMAGPAQGAGGAAARGPDNVAPAVRSASSQHVRQVRTRDHEFVAPRNDLERRLADLWQEVLGRDAISVTDSFFELGGRSLMAVHLFAKIEKVFGVDLPLVTLFRAPTISDCAAAIAEEIGHREYAPSAAAQESPASPARAQIPRPSGDQPTGWSPLVEIQQGRSDRPFFCVHGAGGNVLLFLDLVRHLGADQTVYGLQARGVDGKHPPLRTIEDMAALYIAAIREIQPHGPYLLGGYSGGGVVAFEMARQLVSEGEQTALLALLDTLRPGVPVQHHGLRERTRTVREEGLVGAVRRWLNRMRYVYANWLKTLRVAWHTRRGLAVPHHLREHWMTCVFLEAQSQYQLRLYPGRATLFRAAEAGPTFDYAGRELGWGELVQRGIEVHEIPGNHDSLMLEPHVRVLASSLRACLERARETVGEAGTDEARARTGCLSRVDDRAA